MATFIAVLLLAVAVVNVLTVTLCMMAARGDHARIDGEPARLPDDHATA